MGNNNSFIKLIIAPVFVGVIVSGTAPWWLKYFDSNTDNEPLVSPPVASIEPDSSETRLPEPTPTPQVTPKPIPTTTITPEPVSELGIDYSELEKLLESQNFGAAEVKTGQLVKRLKNSNYPCTDLRTVDRLWNTHSGGRFGLGIQLEIWRSIGGNISEFSRRVGWYIPGRKFSHGDLQFNLDAPRGHLPWLQVVKHSNFLPQVNKCL